MEKPVLIIVNGLPGSGKTTLSRQLATDIQLPVFGRDSLYETIYHAYERQSNDTPPSLLGATAYPLLYSIASTLLAAGKSLVVEAFFGRPELRTSEWLQVQQEHDFEPLQILCKADGDVLIERFLARMGSTDRHTGHDHADQAWIAQHKALLSQGRLAPLTLPGQIIEVDTTTPQSFDYADLLIQINKSHGTS